MMHRDHRDKKQSGKLLLQIEAAILATLMIAAIAHGIYSMF